jgi:predicted O-linked N-acetylglucosamine transferase (SPINDLY family)
VCTPVITYPGAQTVPALAAGMLDEIHLNSSGLIVKSAAEYIDTAVALLGGAQDEVSPHLLELRAHICKKHDILYSNQRAVQEWGDFVWSLH